VPQNPDSGSDDRKPQHDGHDANTMRVELMSGERHVRRTTLWLVERETEKTVEHEHHAHHEQRNNRQEASEPHRADWSV
jgi:hypothetical protein